MSVVLMLIAMQVDNGQGGPPPIILLDVCAVLFGIAVLCSFGRRYTTVAMHPDRLSLGNGADYAKRDIRKILVCESGTNPHTASGEAEARFK